MKMVEALAEQLGIVPVSSKVAKKIAGRKALQKQTGQIGEPVWGKSSKELDDELQIIKALNWYSEHATEKLEKAWVLEYLKTKNLLNSKELDYVQNLPIESFRGLGRRCRMLLQGAPFAPNSRASITTALSVRIIQPALQTARIDPAASESETGAENTVRIRMLEKQRSLLGDYLESAEKSGFSSLDWLNKNTPKPAYCQAILDWIQDAEIPDYAELLEKKPDPQLVEAYAFLTKKQVKARYAFWMQQLEETKSYLAQIRASAPPRKQRKRKPKSPVQQVARLKYLKTYKADRKTEWTSISPTQICGAQYALFYNTKTRKLMVFQAAGPEGFTVKGSTLLGWSVDESMVWRLRKPEIVIPLLFKPNIGIREVKKILKTLTTQAKTPKGRINKDCLIVNTI